MSAIKRRGSRPPSERQLRTPNSKLRRDLGLVTAPRNRLCKTSSVVVNASIREMSAELQKSMVLLRMTSLLWSRLSNLCALLQPCSRTSYKLWPGCLTRRILRLLPRAPKISYSFGADTSVTLTRSRILLPTSLSKTESRLWQAEVSSLTIWVLEKHWR